MTHPPSPHPPMAYGLLLSAAVAIVGIELGKIGWLNQHGFSALTLAIVVGMILGNTIYPSIAHQCGRGVGYSKQMLLRAGIVLFGLKLSLLDIAHVGMTGVLIDTVMLTSTFFLAVILGTRVFGMEPKAAMLIGAGSAICGAAAVMAAEPVVKGRAEQVTVAVATVVIFGTISIFLYPILYNLHWSFLPATSATFGIYEGSTIHEVAQVAAAATSTGKGAAGTAVIAKLVRVMMLAPFLIILSAWLARDPVHNQSHVNADGVAVKPKIVIPWFAFGFVGVVILNSMNNSMQFIPKSIIGFTIDIDTLLLSMAMGALGLATQISSIRQAGIKPILLATVLFVWLIFGGALVNNVIAGLMTH